MPNDHAVRALTSTIALLWLLHVVGSLTGATALWSVSAGAYLPTWLAWATLGLVGAALFPWVGARLARPLGQAASALETRTTVWQLRVFLLVAAGLMLLPDRLGFTGDSLLRISTAKSADWPGAMFPQALPLDLWLHHSVPHQLAKLHVAPVELTSRVLGALEAGLLALLVLAIARRAGLRGIAFAIATLLSFAGMHVVIFTGLNKAFTELVVVAAGLVLCTFPGRHGFWRMVMTFVLFAIALSLHRAALVLLPLTIFEFVGWLRTEWQRERRWKRAAVLGLALLIAVLTVLALVPVARFDVPREAVWVFKGIDPIPFGTRMIDLANLMVFVAPALLLLPALAFDARVRAALMSAWGAWLAAIAMPCLILLVLVDAPQGSFRDWDMFTCTSFLLSTCAALTIGRFLSIRPAASWLAPAIVLIVALPCFQMLALQGDEPSGLVRIEALAGPTPDRGPALRSRTLGFLGKRAWDDGDVARAAFFGRESAMLSPTPSMLYLWAQAEESQANHVSAESVYVQLAEGSPEDVRGWLGIARTRFKDGRVHEATTAAEDALVRHPESIEAADLLRAVRDTT